MNGAGAASSGRRKGLSILTPFGSRAGCSILADVAEVVVVFLCSHVRYLISAEEHDQ